MEVYAQLIEFPQASALAIAGIVVVGISLLFGLFGRDYIKRSKQVKATSRVHHQAIIDIFEDKKLTDSESAMMNDLLDRHAADNPLRAVTTRDGFGLCVQSEMERIAKEAGKNEFKKAGIKLRDIRSALGLDFIPVGKPIYSSRELHPGQVISVAQDKENEKNPTWIRMVLQDIDEAYLYVSRQSGLGSSRFDDGDKVLCKFWRDEDAQYSFPSRIVFNGESHAEWRLGHNAQRMERSQSREHFRMRYEQTANVEILNASAHEEHHMIKQRKAVTQMRGKITSLSAGGCAIVFQQPIAKQVFLRVELDMPDTPKMSLEAKIIASSNISGGRSLVRTRFIATTPEERDMISKYLRHRQQEALLPENP
jgi:c-di-GMP-binding flagellar brake protein YcgR